MIMDIEALQIEKTETLERILQNPDRRSYLEVVKRIQDQILGGIASNEMEEREPPVIHHFGPDIYMRQMDAAEGTLVISRMHSTEHFNILLKGAVSLITEDGIKTLYAPLIMKSLPGTKRIGYFHEDSSWLTIHPTKETDVAKLEEDLTIPESEIDNFLKSIGFEDKEFIACP